ATVNEGTLFLAGNNRLATNGNITVVGGVLDLGGNNQDNAAEMIFQGGLTTNGTITKLGSSYDGRAGTVAANLEGPAGLTKTTAGTLILSGSNSYSGETLIAGGSLRIDSANALPGGIGTTGGTSTLNLTNGGVLGINIAQTFTRDLGTGIEDVRWSDGGGFAAYGADRHVNIGGNTQTLSFGQANFVGLDGELVFGADDSTHTLVFENPFTLVGTNRFRANNGFAAVDGRIIGDIDGTGSFWKTGDGVLELTGSNTYSGGTEVLGGQLLLSGSNSLSANSLLTISNFGVITLGATDFTRNLGTNGGEVVWTGSGGFAALGADRAVNLGGNTQQVVWGSGFFVPEVVDGSVLVLGRTGTTHTVDFQNDIDLGASNRTVRAGDGDAAVDGILSGVLTGSGGLTKTGPGNLLINNTNLFTGGFAIEDGVVYLAGGDNRLDGANALTLGSSASNFSGALVLGSGGTKSDQTFSGIATAGTGISNAIIGGASDISTLTLDLAGGVTNDYRGVLGAVGIPNAENLALTKSGDGLLILSGINSYTGMTLVTGGTLAVGRDAALGGDPLSLITNQLTLNGGTLRATNTFAMLANRGTTLGASGGTIEVDGSRFVTNLGGIFGSGGLTKSGNGVLILTKDSEYSGNTVVAGGVLRLDQTNALPGGTLGAGGPGNLMLTNGGIIGLGATNLTLGLGTGAGQIQFTGDGGFAAYNATANRTVNIGGAGATLTWGSGGFVPDGNALILATTDSTNTLILANGINLGAGSVATQREFRVNNAGSVGDDASLVGVISGTASNDFRKTGAGRVLLTRNNTFAGRLIIEQGVVNITNELALNDIAGSYREDAVLLDGGTLLFSGGANFTLDDANRGFMIGASNGTLDVASGRTITMTNTFIAGSGDLTKAGSGALEFRMLSNRFTGRTILTGGALSIDSEADLGIAPGSFVTNQLQLNGGTLRTLGPNNSTLLLDDPTRGILLTGDSAFDVNAASKTMIVSNEIAGAAGQDLQKVGAGLLILGGTNTYLGATVVRAGVLAVGEEASLGGNPATFQAGQLTISNAATFRALDTFAIDDSRRGVTLGNGGGFISVDADETLTISNVVAGIGTLTKVGNGTLILAATTNTYSGVLGRSTGITTIAGGTLAINNELKLGVLTNDAVPFVANALTISNGGILRALGSFTIDDPWRGVEVGTGGGGFEADSGATLTLASNLITANLITKYGNGVLAINGTSNVLGNVVVTNGGLTFHDADTDQTLINGSLVFSEVTNSPNTTYSRVNRGDFSVTNDILINVGGAKPQTTANAQFKIEATTNDFGTLGDGMGLLERLVNGTLAQGANGVVVGDYARFEIGVPRTNALVTIGQKITIATTGPNYSGDQRNLDFRAENVGTFNTGTMRFDVTNVVMRDGSYLRVNEVNSEVRMGLSLEGTGYLSKSTSAENEDFDLLNVVSSSPGSARTLQIGTINGVSDQPFRSVLFGTGSEDVTFDVYRGKLTMTNGAAIYGTAKVSSGVSSFEILQGTTGYVRQVLVQDGAFSNRGDQVSFSNVVVSGGFAYLDGGESYVTNLYMSGGTSIVATAGVSLGQATFDGGTLRAINDRYLNAFTGVTFTNGGGTITVDPGATLVMDDAMDGNGGLTKIGTGTLVLSNANTYLGGTTLRDGTMLLAGGNDRLASGGNLTIEGGTLDLDGNNQDNSAAVSFQGGLTTNGTITKTGAAFDAQAGIIEAILAGDAGLTKTGTGTVTLVGGSANTFTGLTTVSGGTLALNKTPGVNAIVGDGVGSKTSNDILINGGTLLWLASNQVDNTATITMTSGTMNLNGKKETLYEFHNLGGTFKSGRGGGLTVIDPTWGEGSTNLLEAGTTDSYGNLVIAGGFNRVHGAEDFGTPASLTVGTGGLVFSNSTSPSLILSADHNAAGSLILGGDVSFVGSSGTASIASGPALLYDGENYSVDGDQTGLVRGFVDLNGGTRTFDIGNGASAVDMSVTANIVNLSNSVAGLLKSGVGTLLLGGTNSYDGPTTVGAGTLLVNGDNSLAQGLVTVLGGGTLGGNGTIGGQAIFEAGSTNAPGLFGPGVQTFANGMVFSNAAVFQWELTTNASALALRGSFFDGVDMSSNLLEIASGATMSLVFNRPDSSVNWSDTFWDTNQSWLVFDMIGSGATNGGTANFALDSSFLDSLGNDLATARPGWGFYTSFDGNGDLYLNYAIPEPGTWALMVVGLGLIGYLRRRRKG
ncbi:MAG: autotransporter-associated beta strand repeat-containing protein, partial [Verrucomicrobiae bacterium]|nr:autotransporter-associated beta strand repeat-containing protein [Verrucomicrobiae bacterium]